ncbi:MULTISPECIES: threonine/serine exporter family protein [Clostridium]|uniref:threonine/serine exporter family protein n=1 Tax=Clostridium TaxID=1485 RepID=UPI001897A7BF|nr:MULTISPECIES: threonine/serine exporter family protein [Clostridium]MCR1950118.1 threonine/serine exporter family protein [Clostridium sp. DSM 100503]MDI9215146.1 threonine/serine exporter family protein [Clostridium tertium]
MIIEVLSAFIASFAFGIVFNIKGKNLFFSALCGALGWFIYKFSLKVGSSDTTALFLASVGLSVYSEIFARILKTPVTTFVIAALIPLVPGGGMYYTMVEVITGNVMKSLETGIKTLASAGVLALGVILVSTITKTLIRYNLSKKVKVDPKINSLNS